MTRDALKDDKKEVRDASFGSPFVDWESSMFWGVEKNSTSRKPALKTLKAELQKRGCEAVVSV